MKLQMFTRVYVQRYIQILSGLKTLEPLKRDIFTLGKSKHYYKQEIFMQKSALWSLIFVVNLCNKTRRMSVTRSSHRDVLQKQVFVKT